MDIVFYEKPGCAGNARQKAVLRAAGHEVIARSLLAEPWTAARLRAFFGELPVQDWFNMSAPAVKSGAVRPEALSEDAALALMLATPLLIRRPLLQVGERLCTGFAAAELKSRLGLELPGEAPDGCAHPPAPCP
jgi:nitrogenase-associated protein